MTALSDRVARLEAGEVGDLIAIRVDISALGKEI